MVCVAGSVDADEFVLGGLEAGLESLDFTEPAVGSGLLDAFCEVVDDLDEVGACPGVDAEHGAADAGVFVFAGGAVGSAAVAEFEFADLGVAGIRAILRRWVRGIPRWGGWRGVCRGTCGMP